MFRSTNHRTGGFMRRCASSIDAYPNDQYWDNTAILIPSRAPNNSTDIVDIRGNAITVGGNAKTTTSVLCAGDAPTIALDGTGDYFTLADSAAVRIGFQDFTLEFFRYFNSLATYQTVLSKGYTGAGGLLCQCTITTGLQKWYTNASNFLNEVGTVSTGVVDHYALERYLNTSGTYVVTLYKNGVSNATTTGATNFSHTQEWRFGGGSSTGINDFWVNGGLGMFRLTIGYARYKGAFTPPTYPFPMVDRQE